MVDNASGIRFGMCPLVDCARTMFTVIACQAVLEDLVFVVAIWSSALVESMLKLLRDRLFQYVFYHCRLSGNAGEIKCPN